MKYRLCSLLLLLLCAVTTRAQVIDWEGYCELSSNNSVVSSIAGFTGKADRYKASATDADSKIFKDMVKVCMVF